MKNLSTTMATYDDEAPAEKDWAAVESASRAGSIEIADAALVKRGGDGAVTTIHRQSHHGWGKGAVAGAVIGILFPPTILAGAVAGGAAGGIIARLNRNLDRGDIKDLGEVMDSGEVAMVVVTDESSAATLSELLEGATKTLSRRSSTAEDLQEALKTGADGGL
jgi:uncharacterized membrane protein